MITQEQIAELRLLVTTIRFEDTYYTNHISIAPNSLSELLDAAERADACNRILAWHRDPNRKPPALAFSTGPERELADILDGWRFFHDCLKEAMLPVLHWRVDDVCWRTCREVLDDIAGLIGRTLDEACESGGPWKSYIDLASENAALRARVERCEQAWEAVTRHKMDVCYVPFAPAIDDDQEKWLAEAFEHTDDSTSCNPMEAALELAAKIERGTP